MAKFAWILSMSVGFLSLSQEILWVRLISFALEGLAQSFALVLFFFLLGIAIGSAVGKRFCEHGHDLLRTSAIVLSIAAAVDVSLILLLPALMQWRIGIAGVLIMVMLTAGLKSVMFPIAHHLGSQQSGARVGRSVSKVYFGNIIGSTLGPIVMGYVLLDYLTVDHCILLISLGTGILAIICASRIPVTSPGMRIAAASPMLIATLVWAVAPAIVPLIALATQSPTSPGSRVTQVVQNRHGIIHTVSTLDGEPDTVLGGNVYDGRLNVDMGSNFNKLDRGLVLLGVHSRPERVLVIGLSAGAWVRILSSSPQIKQMTVVEINPGYLQVIAKYPEMAPLLSDPRIRIIIDDGRRWLRSHPEEKFDLIVQNNTYSWRAYSTNLLSQEYMQMVASRLRLGGIAAFNTTRSSDVLRTAQHVFPFVERRHSFVYGSASDFSRPIASAEQAYRELRIDGKPVFSSDAFAADGLARNLIDEPFMTRDKHYADLPPSPGIITDQNLLIEHAHGRVRKILPGFYQMVDQVRSSLPR
jgi:spermidine synthase